MPVCSRCGKSLRAEMRPVALTCWHLYCLSCSKAAKVCHLDTTPTTSVTDFTQQVGQLMQSYNTVYFARELQAFRETINVNCVDCPRGLDCCIRGECVYSHPTDSGASRAQDWKCVQCCVTVESEACPFCMQARPTLHSQTKRVNLREGLVVVVLFLSVLIAKLLLSTQTS